MKVEPGKVKTRFKCGDVVLRIDTGRCGMCGDSIPTGSILRVVSDEDVAGVVRVQYPQADDEDEEIPGCYVVRNRPLTRESQGRRILGCREGVHEWGRYCHHSHGHCHPLGTLHFESWAREIAQSMANIINLQISLGKLTSDGIKVEKTNDKER